MPPPSFVTNENVNFDGNLTPSVVLETIGSVKKLFVWDHLDPAIQLTFEEAINAYGGAIPIAVPQVAKCILDFNGTVVGGNPSGFGGFSTAGTQTADFNGTVVGGNSTGLSNTPATSGFQPAAIAGLAPGAATGLSNAVDATASLLVDSANVDGDVTYTATSIGAGGNAIRVAHVDPAAINQPLTISVVSNDITVNLATDAGGLVTSTAAQVATAINLDGSANLLVSAAPEGVGGGVVLTSPLTNLAGGDDEVIYTLTATIDGGGPQVINIAGNTAQTYSALASVLTSAITGATVTVGTNLDFTSDSTGSTSTVLIVDTDLLSSLLIFITLLAPTAGVDALSYSATITVDGVAKPISVDGVLAQTFTALINEINIDLGASATASIFGGDILVTSSTTGITSTVLMAGGTLFPVLTGFVGFVTPLDGTGAEIVKAIITVNGVDQTVEVSTDTAVTFTDVINEINADLTGATASIVGGDIEIITTATGPTATLKVTDLNLFRQLNGYTLLMTCYRGVNDIDDALRYAKHTNGSSFIEIITPLLQYIDVKPSTSKVLNKNLIYFNGTIWVHLYDDSPV